MTTFEFIAELQDLMHLGYYLLFILTWLLFAAILLTEISSEYFCNVLP
jgi:hypothetical protein